MRFSEAPRACRRSFTVWAISTAAFRFARKVGGAAAALKFQGAI